MMQAAALLEVSHETVYGYAAPVSQAQHIAHLQPLADEHQQLDSFDLQIHPAPQQHSTGRDGFGNRHSFFSLLQPHRALKVHSHSRLQVWPRFTQLQADAAPTWEALRDSLRYQPGQDFDAAVEFALPSPYVPRLAALQGYALPSFPAGTPVAAGALHLMRRIHRDFTYRLASTQVDTPLAQAFEQRQGVCQDFAHLLIGALRMLGLPARYVSGYLLTTPPAGQPALVGADASHAWAQVYSPATPGVPGRWLDLDPTNDMVAAAGHVRLAVGRDFGDVTPLRGVIRGGGRHSLQVRVHTRELAMGPDVAKSS